MANVSIPVASSVYPSGADFATSSAAIPVAPPALFSITTGWPQIALSRGVTAREMLSTEPPAGYATTMRTGLDGKVCVWACVETKLSVRDASAAKAKVRAVIFSSPVVRSVQPYQTSASVSELHTDDGVSRTVLLTF